MQQSLLGATVQVRPQRAGRILELADNTADAVTSGCWQATAALVERFADRMASRLGPGAALVLDGGDAAQLLPLLSSPAELGRDGVLRGLALWADTHLAKRPHV
jgi:type III pantothenate kinase